MDLTVLALRVAFTREIDDNLSTTGYGTFLMELTEADSLRCDGFLVDPPPHNVPYFDAQLEAMANYFENVSNGKVTFNRDSCRIYPEGNDPIVLEGTMASYRPVAGEDNIDSLLVILFTESLVAAAADSDVKVMDYDLVVVFHAGLGDDFAYDFLDPTPLDIRSAYIDQEMIFNALDTTGIPLPDGSLFDRPGILLPEGQNHIYYDIVTDIFPGESNYCDVQIGLTGTFALLVGYALGFPPLFDTDNVPGVPGVGVFGLMDVGSNNGQGVIPAPPTAWTRVYLGWEETEELEGDIALAARHLDEGQVGRISLSTSEYFLIENRLNWVPDLPGVDLDSLRYRNRTDEGYGGYVLPHYFDCLVDSVVGVDTSNGVITSVPNYDLGLPGSGLLIWHVDESRYRASIQGINDDPEARAVALVEADGAVDIGFPTTAIFADPTRGWRWDMWYAGNEAFFMANPDRESSNPQGLLSFDSDTRPSTYLNSGAESDIALWGIGPAGDILYFVVGDENVTRLPEGSRLLGYNGKDWIYVREDSLWLGELMFATRSTIRDNSRLWIISEHDAFQDPGMGFWVLEIADPGYTARRFISNDSLTFEIQDTVTVGFSEAAGVVPHFDQGKLRLWVTDDPVPPSPDTQYVHYEALLLPYMDTDIVLRISQGDIDGDGIVEFAKVKVLIPKDIHVANENGTILDGFPIYGDFRSAVLLANLEGDVRPELAVVEGGDIAIYSPEGRPLTRLGLHAAPSELFLMHTADGRVGLANGDRIHWFEPEEQNPQWVTPQGRHSRSGYSLNDGKHMVDQPAVLDKSRVYNYPNPVTDGRTTIRFYTGQASRATIRIYTVDGLLVARSGKIPNLATNDYNEWVWDVGNNPSGLYYAVVMVEGAESADRQTALVKIAVVR